LRFTTRTLARPARRIEPWRAFEASSRISSRRFSARSSKEERIGAYIIREHERGRQLTEILDDPYIRNRATEREVARLLERPEVVKALGEAAVTEAQNQLG
jgi:hypothetical protein